MNWVILQFTARPLINAHNKLCQRTNWKAPIHQGNYNRILKWSDDSSDVRHFMKKNYIHCCSYLDNGGRGGFDLRRGCVRNGKEVDPWNGSWIAGLSKELRTGVFTELASLPQVAHHQSHLWGDFRNSMTVKEQKIEAFKLDWIMISHSLILWVSRLDVLTEIYFSKSNVVLTFKHQVSLALR